MIFFPYMILISEVCFCIWRISVQFQGIPDASSASLTGLGQALPLEMRRPALWSYRVHSSWASLLSHRDLLLHLSISAIWRWSSKSWVPQPCILTDSHKVSEWQSAAVWLTVLG